MAALLLDAAKQPERLPELIKQLRTATVGDAIVEGVSSAEEKWVLEPDPRPGRVKVRP